MHAGHVILRWMAGSVTIEQDAGDNQKPSKKRSVERIRRHLGVDHGAGSDDNGASADAAWVREARPETRGITSILTSSLAIPDTWTVCGTTIALK
jgi:hypothetical protein